MSVHAVESEDGPEAGLLDTHVGSFLTHLRAAGYADRTLRKKRSIALSFARWTRRTKVTVEDLNESHAVAFLRRGPRRRKAQAALESATVRLFLGYLRLKGGVPSSLAVVEASPEDALLRGYVDYLRGERGLAENSICVYTPYIRDFLTERVARCGCVTPEQFNAPTVHAFVLEHIRSRSSEYARLLGAALRSFLRFLYARGRTPLDLSFAVPAVRRWRQATAPTFLSPEQVERVLSTTDRAIPCGRRDYAVLLLLARLGLRASEVVGMELDDIRWRTAEMIIRGKGGALERMPLLSEIGEALASYLHQDRSHSASRRVFLRMWAPRVELRGPAAVGHIVRRALARAGICRAGRGAAHLFRHSLATRMIRHGASIAEIAEVLRHRSQGTTEIYAKVAFETLRGVARRWPGTGGAR
ncbi:MAG: tyrosine-type recombinase/integrase [Candidatus Rokubacteria bacterium]|nr:tyrosine-type recombinase/integrase [Candidatus Rokubacteria bacterium]